ncbi:MAG: TIGR02147 family protein [Methylotenera sp.]|nr:TIGR02147 family protein [Oligoflexia bacterium]
MLKSVFEYRDYKAYLREVIENRGRGEKSRVAQALHCHLAYVSQVLNASADFSLEQADGINQYLAHSEDEGDFFLLLVSQARAGSESLRKRYEARIKKTILERTALGNRLKNQKILPNESQATYYSAWYYSAIHLLISIPGFQTKEKIAQRLRLSMSQVTKALGFLVETGLANFFEGLYRTGQVTLYLQNDSSWISRHHASWRIQSVRALDHFDPQDFHYTSVVSMGAEDIPAIKKILVDAIEEFRKVVKKSPEQEIYCYTLDFFNV